MLPFFKNVAYVNARKIHCPKGHPLEEGNLVLAQMRRGIRECLICREGRRKADRIREMARRQEIRELTRSA